MKTPKLPHMKPLTRKKSPPKKEITHSDILDYEVRSSWWAKFMFFGWMKMLASEYYIRKVKTKYARWARSYNGRKS